MHCLGKNIGIKEVRCEQENICHKEGYAMPADEELNKGFPAFKEWICRGSNEPITCIGVPVRSTY